MQSHGIVGLFYERIYTDGSIINLASCPNATDFYFRKLFAGHYLEKDITDQLYIPEGISLWALNSNNQIWQDMQNNFGYGNGVTLYEKHEAFDEIMGFYSTVDNHAINHFYINQADQLKKLKQWFISHATKLIHQAEKDKSLFSHPSLPPKNIHHDPYYPPTNLPNYTLLPLNTSKSTFGKLDWNSIFELPMTQLDKLLTRPRYRIELDMRQFTLSRMEIKTLLQLLRGKYASEIALSLNIKQSTAESYLLNIKNKLDVNHKSELIQRVINSQLLQQIDLK